MGIFNLSTTNIHKVPVGSECNQLGSNIRKWKYSVLYESIVQLFLIPRS